MHINAVSVKRVVLCGGKRVEAFQMAATIDGIGERNLV